MKLTKNHTFLFLSIFLVHLVLRWFAWTRTILLEDHDSIAYLSDIKVFLSFDLQKIIEMRADSLPLFPFFGALFSLPGWSLETGARLSSLLFATLLFVALVGIGKQIAKPMEIAFGLLIVTFSPVLISLSFSVLSEPSYIAISYLGLWFFWTQYEDPRLWKGVVLGIVFGLCFLSRNEGILYLATIPFLQSMHFVFVKGREYELRRLVGWTCLFLLGFSLMAGPQIWRVSNKMGFLATNGRDVWALLLRGAEDTNSEEKLYGLDFDPSQINLFYVQSHPEARMQLATDFSPVPYVRAVVKNFDKLYQSQIGALIGPFGFAFFALGLVSLYQFNRRFEVLLILGFIGINLIGPLLHSVPIRHIAIIAPLILFIEGIGIVYVAQRLPHRFRSSRLRLLASTSIIFLTLVAVWALPFFRIYLKPAWSNWEYSPVYLQEPIRIVKEIGREAQLETRIVARKSYLGYFADAKTVALPYTDYEGLVRYCELNNIDLLFLQHRLLASHPFLEKFTKGNPPLDFTLLHREVDGSGRRIELYSFERKNII